MGLGVWGVGFVIELELEVQQASSTQTQAVPN